jgi:hypothetical protein
MSAGKRLGSSSSRRARTACLVTRTESSPGARDGERREGNQKRLPRASSGAGANDPTARTPPRAARGVDARPDQAGRLLPKNHGTATDRQAGTAVEHGRTSRSAGRHEDGAARAKLPAVRSGDPRSPATGEVKIVMIPTPRDPLTLPSRPPPGRHVGVATAVHTERAIPPRRPSGKDRRDRRGDHPPAVPPGTLPKPLGSRAGHAATARVARCPPCGVLASLDPNGLRAIALRSGLEPRRPRPRLRSPRFRPLRCREPSTAEQNRIFS